MAPTAVIRRDVVVVGAGWSGLLVCKSMLEYGLSVVVLEKRDTIGGVWCYSDDPNILTVMKSSQCTSSSSLTEMSDFPMPDEMGEFPNQEQIFKYLNDYCDNFSLRPHIRLNSGVKKAEKVDNKWEVITEDGKKYISTYLVLSTGVHHKANRDLETTLFKEYTGELLHSQVLKSFVPAHKGKTVLVFGGGETAADIVEEWHEGGANQIIWSIPRGQHFFRKYAKLLPHRPPQALDKASSRAMKVFAPYTKGKPGLSWVCNWTTGGSLLAYQGHGIPEWKNDAQFFHFFINKNGHVLDLVDYEHVVPKGAIDRVQGKTVVFNDGSQADVDVVMQCTGYHKDFPFIPEKYQLPMKDLYKFIFNVEDPSIAFVGYVRPVVGSIPLTSEIQSIFVARVFSGIAKLPQNGDIVNKTNQDKEFWTEYFKDSSQRLESLVENYTYLDDIAETAGIFPNYRDLLKTNPREWATAIFTPTNACQLQLNNPAYREKALAHMRKRAESCFNPLQYLLILFLRLIWFDWWLSKLSEIKFFFQTNSYCKQMQKWRIVRFLDWIWTTPKRVLFDNKSRPYKKKGKRT